MLTTIYKCKNYLNIADEDSTQDGFIIDLILSAQSVIESYCKRRFDLQAYIAEQHTINHCITPLNYPIKQVNKVVRLDQLVTNYKVFPSHIQMLDAKFATITNRNQWVDQEESYIEIDYIAGYDDLDVPADLCLACTKLVALEYKNSREDRLGIDNDTVGPLKTQYSKESAESGIPKYVTIVLDKYKKARC